MLGGCLQKWLKFEGVSEIIPFFFFYTLHGHQDISSSSI
jgi:hypothetical protein